MMLNTHEGKVISCLINDETSLHLSYLSFVKHGGLFIPTANVAHYVMGQFVCVTLMLMLETPPFFLHGKIIWITPLHSVYRTAGIGIQFNTQEWALKAKIEAYLAERQDSDHLTHTL